MFQDSQRGQMFYEISAGKLRELQDVYLKFTSTSCSDGCEDNGRCYIMPKLQKLLSALKEFKYSPSKGEQRTLINDITWWLCKQEGEEFKDFPLSSLLKAHTHQHTNTVK